MMIIRKIKITLTIFSLFILTACNESINEPKYMGTTSHFLLPAKIGNYWEYTRYTPDLGSSDSALVYKNFNSFGLLLNSDVTQQSIRWEIIDSIDVKLNHIIYPSYVFDFYSFDQSKYVNYNKPYWFGEEGIYHMGIFEKGGDTLFSKGLYIPSNITLNSSWNGSSLIRYNGIFTSKNVEERKCISKNEIIETPIGKYNCYVIYTRENEADDYTLYIDSYEYFAPNIGLVCKVVIDIVPDYEILPNYRGWWRIRYVYMINNYIVN